MKCGENGDQTRNVVRDAYARIANKGGSCCGSSPDCGCDAAAVDRLARRLGYSGEELAAIPEESNLGLSCGNPTALASLRAGEAVLDLGAGGGFDVFIAARKVGQSGRVIGVDMTAEMVTKARTNAARFREETGLNNIEFRLGEIEHLPVADSSVDVVISNCVINLSPDKPQVWREIARVLKPGGRAAISDLALLRPLPPEVAESVTALVGCIAGAVLVGETEAMARAAGLTDIALASHSYFSDSAADGNDPAYKQIIALLPPGMKLSDYVTSLNVTAIKKG